MSCLKNVLEKIGYCFDTTIW